MTKIELIAKLANTTSLPKSQVGIVLAALGAEAIEQLRTDGEFTVPGMIKLAAIKRPAKPARDGINPFTKAPTTFAAKPASIKIRGRALKALKVACAT